MSAMRTRTWEKAVFTYFDLLPRKVFLRTEFGKLLTEHRSEWAAPESLTASRLMAVLKENGHLHELRIVPDRPKESARSDASMKTPKPIVRYAWGTPDPYAIGASLRSGAYLSHASAMFLHGLTQELPKTIYVNKEQSFKPPGDGGLTQEALDRAFKSRQRVSTYVFSFEGYRYVLLSGKSTNRLEVSEMALGDKTRVPVTKLERTLIDISVRPVYAGGVFEVAKAFAAAKPNVSVATLLATLRKLNYVYPYHQVIGYYMARAGYDRDKVEKFKSFGLNYDFYLANGLPAPHLVPEWRLWVPEGM